MDAQIEAIWPCKYLYLQSISEPEVNRLSVVVLEATSDSPRGETMELSGAWKVPPKPVSSTRPILHGLGCRIFEVSWDSYIGYAVQNESYSVAQPRCVKGGCSFDTPNPSIWTICQRRPSLQRTFPAPLYTGKFTVLITPSMLHPWRSQGLPSRLIDKI
jgi:hypothetical protein